MRTRDAYDPLGQLTRDDTRLDRLPRTLGRLYDDFLNRPGQKLVLGALSLLFGFYLAGSLSTIFGAAAFWEPVSALIPALVCERISREYYLRDSGERSTTLMLCAGAAPDPHRPSRAKRAPPVVRAQAQRAQVRLLVWRRARRAQTGGLVHPN